MYEIEHALDFLGKAINIKVPLGPIDEDDGPAGGIGDGEDGIDALSDHRLDLSPHGTLGGHGKEAPVGPKHIETSLPMAD